MLINSTEEAKTKLEVSIGPKKFISTAPNKIGNCAMMAQRVNRPKTIKKPPTKCAGAM